MATTSSLPSPSIKAIIEKTAVVVAKSGRTLESRILNSAKGKKPEFAFLKENSEFHYYYQERVTFHESQSHKESSDDGVSTTTSLVVNKQTISRDIIHPDKNENVQSTTTPVAAAVAAESEVLSLDPKKNDSEDNAAIKEKKKDLQMKSEENLLQESNMEYQPKSGFVSDTGGNIAEEHNFGPAERNQNILSTTLNTDQLVGKDSLEQLENTGKLKENRSNIEENTDEKHFSKSKVKDEISTLKTKDKPKHIKNVASLEMTTMSESSLLETQHDHQTQMKKVQDLEERIRQQNIQLRDCSILKDQFEKSQLKIDEMVEENLKLDNEVQTLRNTKEGFKSVLHNRLDEATKKKDRMSNEILTKASENKNLTEELYETREQLESVLSSKQKIDVNLEKIKKKCIDRVKQSENLLIEERNLNDERKQKMKQFVETKAEELRVANCVNEELVAELNETNSALKSLREKLEHSKTAHLTTQSRNRDLMREINRMKKNSEQLHQLGDNLELELHKSTQETEEHKNKRVTAKHELMSMLRKLEAEQTVSEKLRDSIKFTFTPKALSQQQLLTENIKCFENELLSLSRLFGITGINIQHVNNDVGKKINETSSAMNNVKKPLAKANSRAEWDTARLLSNLENETQLVSKGIMALGSAVEKLHKILEYGGGKTCVSAFNDFLTNVTKAEKSIKSLPISQVVNNECNEEQLVGLSHVERRRHGDKYGLVESTGT